MVTGCIRVITVSPAFSLLLRLEVPVRVCVRVHVCRFRAPQLISLVSAERDRRHDGREGRETWDSVYRCVCVCVCLESGIQ